MGLGVTALFERGMVPPEENGLSGSRTATSNYLGEPNLMVRWIVSKGGDCRKSHSGRLFLCMAHTGRRDRMG